MNVVDSSGWLEFFADGKNADFFAPAISNTGSAVIPTICICEVFKRTMQQRGEDEAVNIAGFMRQGMVVDLGLSIAVAAARIGHESRLPLADSIVLATARAFGATLWTQDADFEGIDGVRFIRKRKG